VLRRLDEPTRSNWPINVWPRRRGRSVLGFLLFKALRWSGRFLLPTRRLARDRFSDTSSEASSTLIMGVSRRKGGQRTPDDDQAIELHRAE